jgi:hypothetical protein
MEAASVVVFHTPVAGRWRCRDANSWCPAPWAPRSPRAAALHETKTSHHTSIHVAVRFHLSLKICFLPSSALSGARGQGIMKGSRHASRAGGLTGRDHHLLLGHAHVAGGPLHVVLPRDGAKVRLHREHCRRLDKKTPQATSDLKRRERESKPSRKGEDRPPSAHDTRFNDKSPVKE